MGDQATLSRSLSLNLHHYHTHGLIQTILRTNSCNGTFEMSLSGGTTPYSYSWTNCSSNCSDSVKTDLCAGTYTITGTDANSCISFSETVTIIDAPLTPTACISGSDATCNGASDGTAQAYLSAKQAVEIYYILSYCASAPEIQMITTLLIKLFL